MDNYSNRLKVDLSFGIRSEINLLDTFKTFFNDQTLVRTSESSIFDYEGNNILVELKTRTNKKDKYPDTMIGLNKVKKASAMMKKNSELEVYFVFSFTDGLYYWKYDAKHPLKVQQGGRTDRGRQEIKSYAFIEVDILSKLEIPTVL
jgi:hypothetical protein